MINKIKQGEASILSLVREVDKLVDENEVNERLKSRKWVLISAGNMMQVQKCREGMKTKIAIGQTPYYVLGKIEV